jgi:hypothetical protein
LARGVGKEAVDRIGVEIEHRLPHLVMVEGCQLEMDRLGGLGVTQAMGQWRQRAVQHGVLVGQQVSGAVGLGASSTLGLLWMRRVFPAFSKLRI